MLHNISLGPISDEEEKVISFLKKNSFDKVLDIGGVQRPWARPYVTHYLDLLYPETWANRYPEMYKYEGFWNKNFIREDVNDVSIWDKLDKPFDFVICTQVLEHLGDPKTFLLNLFKIANSGFISIPHKLFELRKGVHWDHSFRGALPHRWINVIRDNKLIMYPKLSFIEYLTFDSDDRGLKIPDLSFWWENSFDFNIIDDSYLDFSDPTEAENFYRNELNKDGIYG
jgi:hypothetical protein